MSNNPALKKNNGFRIRFGRSCVVMWALLWMCVSVLQVCVASHSHFTCEPVHVQWCDQLHYNQTFFPNLMEHRDQETAAQNMQEFMPLVRVRCSPDVLLFLCQSFIPECQKHTLVLQPCREQCERVQKDCSREIYTFGLSWPPELQCEKLELCQFSPEISTEELNKPITSPSISSERDWGFWCPAALRTGPGLGSRFLGAEDCAPPCRNMYLDVDEEHFIKLLIGTSSVLSSIITLFTFLTFLVQRQRFLYPERPILFLSACQSGVALLYLLGFLLGPVIACSAPQGLGGAYTALLGSQGRGCSLVATLLYFCFCSGFTWWLVLMVTWFLAAVPKWSNEAIAASAPALHGFGWGVPAVLTLVMLVFGKVEGDGLSGVCFTGLYDLLALRWFLLTPLVLTVLGGLGLLLAGVISLNGVRREIQHDLRNQRKLQRFMIRIGIFSGLYLLPLLTLLGCLLTEHSMREDWEKRWIYTHCREMGIPCPRESTAVDLPSIWLILLKYLMTLLVGSSTVFWVSSRKTFSEWAAFFTRARKKDPISESRRVLEESCRFFLQHNAQKHKNKQSGNTHQLKVLSRSTGTSTGLKREDPVEGSAGQIQGPKGTSCSEMSAMEHSKGDSTIRTSRDAMSSSESTAQHQRQMVASLRTRANTNSSSQIPSPAESSHRSTLRDEKSIRMSPTSQQSLSQTESYT